jgi:hypothetical protein
MEEVLENSLVELLEEINIVLKEFHHTSSLKLLDSLSTMLDVQHVKESNMLLNLS